MYLKTECNHSPELIDKEFGRVGGFRGNKEEELEEADASIVTWDTMTSKIITLLLRVSQKLSFLVEFPYQQW